MIYIKNKTLFYILQTLEFFIVCLISFSIIFSMVIPGQIKPYNQQSCLIAIILLSLFLSTSVTLHINERKNYKYKLDKRTVYFNDDSTYLQYINNNKVNIVIKDTKQSTNYNIESILYKDKDLNFYNGFAGLEVMSKLESVFLSYYANINRSLLFYTILEDDHIAKANLLFEIDDDMPDLYVLNKLDIPNIKNSYKHINSNI